MADRIDILTPRSIWAADFAALKASILAAIPPPLALHHIGSTAVPGLCAKDVIDIQITVADLSAFDDAAMRRHGFMPRPALLDHDPPGRALPEAERAKRFYRGPGRAANIHVRATGRFNQRYALLCRDFLRSHPDAASAYGAVKQQLAARFATDVDAYYDIKDPVCDIIMAGAEEWAARIGWTLPPSD